MALQAPAAPPVPGSGSAPQLPAPSAPPPPTSTAVTASSKEIEERFLAVMPDADRHTFDLVRRQYFSEVAKLETIVHVATMCREKGLDLHGKPFHVVTIDGKDYIWSSIGLYRIIAHRTGEYMGMSEPLYGPEKEFTFAGEKFTVPEWCQITTYRLKNGVQCPFPQRVYYEEQLVLDKGKPNKMWRRRPRGQMAKGAESAALRAGFPEVGETPTIEEMEGREHEYTAQSVHAADVDESTGEVLAKSHMSPQQKEEQVKKVFAKPDIKARQQKAAAQPVARLDTTSGSDEQATQDEQPAAQVEAKGDSAPPPPPPAAEQEETVEAEIVDEGPPGEVDDPIVTKTELGGLLQITRGQGFADGDMATIVCKKFGIKSHAAMPAELKMSQWREACNWFAEHTPGDTWE